MRCRTSPTAMFRKGSRTNDEGREHPNTKVRSCIRPSCGHDPPRNAARDQRLAGQGEVLVVVVNDWRSGEAPIAAQGDSRAQRRVGQDYWMRARRCLFGRHTDRCIWRWLGRVDFAAEK